MRKLGLVLAGLLIVPTARAAKSATVDQLQQLVAGWMVEHKKDGDIAHQLASIHLTERLADQRLERMTEELKPGRKTALALQLMADLSSCMALPPSELPSNPPPDKATQTAMFLGAVDYSRRALARLPDFLATRTTLSFDDSSPMTSNDGGMLDMHSELHLVDGAREDITYMHGTEVAVARNGATHREALPRGLWSTGEFGPTLANILVDATKGQVVWSHWEQTPTGVAAVFRYHVPADASTYHLNYGGANKREDRNAYHGTPGYHGYLTIDPATGAVLRYTLECEFGSTDPITQTALTVQYGSVPIGESSYLCPIRSVALMRGLHAIGNSEQNTSLLSINEVTFTGYRRFGSIVRVLPETPAQ